MNTMHEQLYEILSAFWDENVLDVPADDGDSDDEIAIDHPLVQLDSITAVEVMIDVEKVVGKELPIEKIVRKGGYTSKEQFIEDVTRCVDEFIGESS